MSKNLYVEDRLLFLHKKKQPLIPHYEEWTRKYWGEVTGTEYEGNDYRSNITFSVIQNKKSEIIAGTQEYDFIPLDDDGTRNVPLIKEIWKYEWLKTNTDWAILDAITSALKYWDWYLYEWMRRIERMVKVPMRDWGFKEEKRTEWDWIYTEYIPWKNLYHDQNEIEKSNECIWIKHWDYNDYMNKFSWKYNLKWVTPWNYYYINWDDGSLELNSSIDDWENNLTELTYRNKSKDIYIKVANGVEVLNTFIPYEHKEIPIVQFIDYKLEWRSCNMGEIELIKEDEFAKDKVRSLSIDITQAQLWFTTISPLADFDNSTIEMWVGKFIKADPEDIRHFAPNISSNGFLSIENKIDEDIIIKTWIDFRSQLLSPEETAEKTKSKNASSRKRINTLLKENAFWFFRRLAILRMSNIQQYYSDASYSIPVKNYSISSDGIKSPTSWWYWLYTTIPDHIKGKFNIMPITESILWLSTEKEKNKVLEFSQIAWTPIFMWDDWKTIINKRKLAEKVTRVMWFNFDELSASAEVNKTPEDIINEVDMLEWGTIPWSMEDPNYIPPEQRSGALTSKIWGLVWE